MHEPRGVVIVIVIMIVVFILDRTAGVVTGIVLFLARVRGFGCVVAGTAAAATAGAGGAGASAGAILVVAIIVPGRGEDASIFASAFDAFVAVLVQRGKVLPQIFVHGRHWVPFPHRRESLRERA